MTGERGGGRSGAERRLHLGGKAEGCMRFVNVKWEVCGWASFPFFFASSSFFLSFFAFVSRRLYEHRSARKEHLRRVVVGVCLAGSGWRRRRGVRADAVRSPRTGQRHERQRARRPERRAVRGEPRVVQAVAPRPTQRVVGLLAAAAAAAAAARAAAELPLRTEAAPTQRRPRGAQGDRLRERSSARLLPAAAGAAARLLRPGDTQARHGRVPGQLRQLLARRGAEDGLRARHQATWGHHRLLRHRGDKRRVHRRRQRRRRRRRGRHAVCAADGCGGAGGRGRLGAWAGRAVVVESLFEGAAGWVGLFVVEQAALGHGVQRLLERERSDAVVLGAAGLRAAPAARRARRVDVACERHEVEQRADQRRQHRQHEQRHAVPDAPVVHVTLRVRHRVPDQPQHHEGEGGHHDVQDER
eukprot:Rhum_TRINITY_DN14777_c9_g1::Rhum_TRINITY_DN14777_c9_g1_i1::g.116007::m.116007